MKLIFIDTETTGFGTVKHDMIQLGCIIEIDGEVKEKVAYNIKPGENVEWSKEAMEKTKLNPEIAATFPESSDVYKEFEALLGSYIDKYAKQDKAFFVGYNAKFDEEFIRAWFIKNAPNEDAKQKGNYFGSFFWTPSIDVMQLAALRSMRVRQNFPDFKLGTVCKALGIDFNDNEAHSALYDIEKTRELYHFLKKV